MKYNYDALLDLAQEPSQAAIKKFNYDADVRASLKATTIRQYATIQAVYYTAKYGKYTGYAAGMLITGLYAGALLLNPALVPFGLAAITTVWLKWTVASLAGAISAYFALAPKKGVVQKTYAEFGKLQERIQDGQSLTKYDFALLTGMATLGGALVGALALYPATVHAAGLSLTAKAGAAVVPATVSAYGAYGMMKAGIFRYNNPPAGGAAAAAAVEPTNVIKCGASA